MTTTKGARGAIDAERAKLDAGSAIVLSSKELLELMTVAVATPMDGEPGTPRCLWGLPVLVEGEPGIAKTARVKQLAASLQTKLQIFFAAPHPPESFAGALIPDGKGDAVNVVSLSALRELIKHGEGILYLDELNGALPATQGAIQSLIHERHSGGTDIPGEIRILATQNPAEIATGGNELAPAVANRFVHISDPGPTAEEWKQWRIGNTAASSGRTLIELTTSIVSEWKNKFPVACGLLAGFIERMPAELHRRPYIGDDHSGKAWASHRTWDYATRAWAAADILGISDNVKHALIEACVGVGGASQFMTYVHEVDIPSPTEVLAGTWKINKDRLDIVFAAYGAATAYVCQRPDVKERYELAPSLWNSYLRLIQAGMADLSLPLTEQAIRANCAMNSEDKKIKAACSPVLVELSNRGLVAQKGEKAT